MITALEQTQWTCRSCGWVNHKIVCGHCSRRRGAEPRNVSFEQKRGGHGRDLVDMMSPVSSRRGDVQTWPDGAPWG